MAKRNYVKPEITLVKLDYSISLQMQSMQPSNPIPRTGPQGTGSKDQETFSSPFSNDKPFG